MRRLLTGSETITQSLITVERVRIVAMLRSRGTQKDRVLNAQYRIVKTPTGKGLLLKMVILFKCTHVRTGKDACANKV
jgi:hypothetical protein